MKIYESVSVNMNFEELIFRCKREMEEKNMTNRDIARIANISEPTVSRILSGNGQNTSVASLSAICAALGIAEPYKVVSESSSVEDIYKERIDDLKSIISNKDKWIRCLFIACAVLVAFVLCMLAIDILNPNVGWVRAAHMELNWRNYA